MAITHVAKHKENHWPLNAGLSLLYNFGLLISLPRRRNRWLRCPPPCLAPSEPPDKPLIPYFELYFNTVFGGNLCPPLKSCHLWVDFLGNSFVNPDIVYRPESTTLVAVVGLGTRDDNTCVVLGLVIIDCSIADRNVR